MNNTPNKLTKRELQVARLRCKGFSYGEISTKLDKKISIRTVESHLNSIKDKIKVLDTGSQFLAKCLLLNIYSMEELKSDYG
jgi:DNA-binding NarL/FixJ family response regulator